MALKDLLVHVNGSKHAGQRIEIAIMLARRFDAHLTGLYIVPDLPMPTYVAAQMPVDVMELERKRAKEAETRAHADFESRIGKAGLRYEWREREGEPSEIAALEARYADLVIVGQNDPEEDSPEGDFEVPERVVLESGRPALLIPYAGRFPTLGERVLIAWNASVPAARAVHDALPLISGAKEVTILSVNPRPLDEGEADDPGAALARHLARHGLKAEASHVNADDIGVGDMILSRAADAGADLIVMGGYGHSRWREVVLGGATRALLAHMTVPVLMSH